MLRMGLSCISLVGVDGRLRYRPLTNEDTGFRELRSIRDRLYIVNMVDDLPVRGDGLLTFVNHPQSQLWWQLLIFKDLFGKPSKECLVSS
jgi:hypothetical protein